MIYYVYQITCKVNGKIYVGCHRTKDIDDGYMGSGRRLAYAKKKYGIDAFEKIILSKHKTAEEMFAEEKRIVNEAFVNREDVYNLQVGGGGGFSKWHEENARAFHRAGWQKMMDGKDFSASTKKAWKNNPTKMKTNIETARLASITDKSIAKRKSTMQERGHMKGEKNSQFGTCWVTNGSKPIKIKKEQLDEYLANGYSRGRKMG